MNSYIKLKNGLIINLSQIELIGPVMPLKLTVQGVMDGDDESKFFEGTFDLGIALTDTTGRCNQEEIEDIVSKVFCVPSDSPANTQNYNMKQHPGDLGYEPQPYMILLKSGRYCLLTKAEYDDICNVMQFSDENNYSNIDYKYTRFS